MTDRKARQTREPDILTASAEELRSIVEAFGLRPSSRSPLRTVLSEAGQSPIHPASVDLNAWKSHRKALDALCEPLHFVRLTMPGAQSRTQRTFFAGMAGGGFSGLWRDNGGWRFAPAISSDYILEIADEALGLHGTEDVAQTAHEWTATGLFTLAAALDSIRLRHLGEWIYRQPPSAQPFTLQDLNDQLRLGLESADPRWSVAMLAAVLPAGTFSIATNLAEGLSELADTDGFVEYADGQKTRWIPGKRLQELAAEWFAPISALLLESVVLGKAGVFIARDSCALVRGQGPLILLDFGRAVRGETAAKVAMTRVEPEQSYVRLHTALVSPSAIVATNEVDSGDGEIHSPNSQNVGEARNSHKSENSEARMGGKNVADADLNKRLEAELGKAVVPTVAAPPIRNRYCTQCGTPLRASAAFCTSCGTAAISP